MMIESMAGKSASLNALAFDATPFTFSEEDPAIDYFGNLLKQCMVFCLLLNLNPESKGHSSIYMFRLPVIADCLLRDISS